jgi:hypothetical protein
MYILNKEYSFCSLISPCKGVHRKMPSTSNPLVRYEMLFVSGINPAGGYYKNISSPWNVAWPAGILLDYKTYGRSAESIRLTDRPVSSSRKDKEQIPLQDPANAE